MIDATGLPIRCAQLDWTEDGAPLSVEFEDIYFSKQSGIDETRYVFLENNQLPERFSALAKQQHAQFSIGETGFGTGLNFLCAWQLRDQLAPKSYLHFVSVEKHPLSLEDLTRALSSWPDLHSYADQLIKNYPILTPGWHHISFVDAQVELNLYLGDVLEGYRDYSASIEAWFLDGFAPSKNPPMWSQELFQQIRRISGQETTFSTFSAAAEVREGLKQVGFTVERVKGFANKRHMLKGTLADLTLDHQLNARELRKPWFAIPEKETTNKLEAVVIGGGIAGTSAAYSLARRGWQVTLLERNNQLGREASGNRQGILYNKMSAEPSINSNFYTAGYLYAVQHLNQFNTNKTEGTGWNPCGVIQLAYNAKERERQARFLKLNPQPQTLVYAVDNKQASDIAGIDLETGGLFYPDGGWATPSTICVQQASHPNIQLELGTEVETLVREGDDWLLFDTAEKIISRTKLLIIANAKGSAQFEFTRDLPLKAIRGQTTDVPASPDTKLNTVLCGKGYIGPAIAGRHYMGATFNLDCSDKQCRAVDHKNNLQEISKMAPSLADAHNFQRVSDQETQGRVGFRCTSPDYLPLIGPVPDQAKFINNYAGLRKDARLQFSDLGEYLPGLYISVGHGSKGLTSCPIGGELLAAYINREPFPFSSQLIHALNPGRFLIRDLIRNKI